MVTGLNQSEGNMASSAPPPTPATMIKLQEPLVTARGGENNEGNNNKQTHENHLFILSQKQPRCLSIILMVTSDLIKSEKHNYMKP